MSPPFSQRAFTLAPIREEDAHGRVSEQPIEDPPSVTDEEALHRLKERDKEALALLFDRYSRLILTIGVRILRDHGEAEELMQNVFVYLYEKAGLFQPEKGPGKSWIIQVAYHRALDRRAYLVRRQFYLGTDLAVEPDTLSGSFDVEREIGSKLNREQILRALEALPEKQRLTLELFFFEGLDLREISDRLGDSLANVRHHYYRGLDKLRKTASMQQLRDKSL